MFNTQQLLMVVAVMGTASAHMQMQFPAPFKSNFNQFAEKGTDAASNMNAPLKADGSDFPCKGFQSDLGTPAGQPTASFAVGGQGNITIADGGAPHGGGSCQISLSMDGAKTFTVMQSIIGGCPASGASYDFTIPEDTPTGDAILAWTWHNNIGNREMYMNCAAVTLTGGSAKRSGAEEKDKRAAAFSSRPGIYIANVGPAGDGCTTTGTDNKDIIYPNPGPDVQDTSSNSIAVPCGLTQGTGAVTGGSGSGSSGSGSESGAASSSSSSSVTTSAASSQTTNQGGVFATGSSTTLTTTRTTTFTTATTKASGSASASATYTTAPTTTTESGSGSGSATSTPSGGNAPGSQCSPEGTFLCLPGGTSFQRCASGEWSVVQEMAQGTTCNNADVSTSQLNVLAVGGGDQQKRRHLLRHRRSHM